MAILKELKEFMMRGNVIDLAVGVVIGGAFGKIVSSLVSDIIMPPLGMLLSGVDFKDLAIVLKHATVDAAGQTVPAVTLNYGNFIQNILDFVIIATAIFFAVKGINMLRRQKEEEPAKPAEPTQEEKLLTEIRDILKEQEKSLK